MTREQVRSGRNRTHGWFGLAASSIRETLKPDATITDAAIAYSALYSLLPLTLLAAAIVDIGLGPLMDQFLQQMQRAGDLRVWSRACERSPS